MRLSVRRWVATPLSQNVPSDFPRHVKYLHPRYGGLGGFATGTAHSSIVGSSVLRGEAMSSAAFGWLHDRSHMSDWANLIDLRISPGLEGVAAFSGLVRQGCDVLAVPLEDAYFGVDQP